MAESLLARLGCRHPLGLGAGPDRYGERSGRGLADAVAAGFAFVELGTVTPAAEPDHNPGAAALAASLACRPLPRDCIVGINIGCRFAIAPARIADDWCTAIAAVGSIPRFVTINLSAPYYAPLLDAKLLNTVTDALACARHALPAALPLLVKLPFGRLLDEDGVAALLPTLASCGTDAIIVSSSALASHAAGAHIAQARASGLPIVASGGVRNPADLQDRLAAGAVLVQVYSAFADATAPAMQPLMAAAEENRFTAPVCGR